MATLTITAQGDMHRVAADRHVTAFVEWARVATAVSGVVEIEGRRFVAADLTFAATSEGMVDAVLALEEIGALDRGGSRGR